MSYDSRRYFAARAMQGILSNERCIYMSAEAVAESAVKHADALIVELDKPFKINYDNNNKKDEDTVRTVRR